MGMRNLTVGMVSAGVMLAGVIIASPAHGQESPDAVVPEPVTARVHTPAGSGIKVVHAKLKNGNRLVKATVTWNKALLAKPGTNDRFNVRVVAVAKGKKAKTTALAATSSSVAKRRTQVRFWLSTSQARAVRAAKTVVFSVSQQYDSPADRDNKYEDNYVSAVYLAGSTGTQAPGLRTCTAVKIEPHAQLSYCELPLANLANSDLSGADLSGANLVGVDLSGANLHGADLSLATWVGGRQCADQSIGWCR